MHMNTKVPCVHDIENMHMNAKHSCMQMNAQHPCMQEYKLTVMCDNVIWQVSLCCYVDT